MLYLLDTFITNNNIASNIIPKHFKTFLDVYRRYKSESKHTWHGEHRV